MACAIVAKNVLNTYRDKDLMRENKTYNRDISREKKHLYPAEHKYGYKYT